MAIKLNKTDFVLATTRRLVPPHEMLRILRELQGLSQTEMAKMTNISQSNISALENGSRKIGRERAITLAKALKVHPAVILFSDFEMNDVA